MLARQIPCQVIEPFHTLKNVANLSILGQINAHAVCGILWVIVQKVTFLNLGWQYLHFKR